MTPHHPPLRARFTHDGQGSWSTAPNTVLALPYNGGPGPFRVKLSLWRDFARRFLNIHRKFIAACY